MRLVLSLLLAGSLGIVSAFLVACGSSSNRLISSANASQLKNDLDQVAQAVASQDCTGARDSLARAHQDVRQLPSTVDPRLTRRLRQGLNNLDQQVPRQCVGTTTTPTNTQTTTTPTTTETTTTPTNTTTTPTNTTTTPTNTTPTTTTPTGTTTTPTTTGPGGTPPGDGNGGGQ
jgi:hypothetical protein